MIEPARRHGPFDPRYRAPHGRAGCAPSSLNGAVPGLRRSLEAAQRSEEAQGGAVASAAVEAWEGEGGATLRLLPTMRNAASF
jgi:hypothetical protein